MLGEHLSKTKDRKKLRVIATIVVILLLAGILLLIKSIWNAGANERYLKPYGLALPLFSLVGTGQPSSPETSQTTHLKVPNWLLLHNQTTL